MRKSEEHKHKAILDAISNDLQIIAVQKAIADLMERSERRILWNETGPLINFRYKEHVEKRIEALLEVKEDRIFEIISHLMQD